jgi:tRNA G10  N-methylase Trm11
MANICNTDLKLYRENKPFTGSEVESIEKWLNDNIAYDGVYDNSGEGEEFLEINMGTKWNIPIEELKTFAKMFNTEVRAIGREDGMGFIQFVKINDKGELLEDKELNTA